jgi:hypothetical protein
MTWLQFVQSNIVDMYPSSSGVGGPSFASSSSLSHQVSRLAGVSPMPSFKPITEDEEGDSASASAHAFDLVSLLLVCQEDETVAVLLRPRSAITSVERSLTDCVLPQSTLSLPATSELLAEVAAAEDTREGPSSHSRVEETRESLDRSEQHVSIDELVPSSQSTGRASAVPRQPADAVSLAPDAASSDVEMHRPLDAEPGPCSRRESGTGDSEQSRRLSGTGTDDTQTSSTTMPVVSLRGALLPAACCRELRLIHA